MILGFLLAIFLVLLNGFFVAAEFAIVKVRLSQIQLQAEKGIKSAKVSKKIIEKLDAYLSATQLGITLASLGLGWIGEPVIAQIIEYFLHIIHINLSPETLHTVSFTVGFLFITFLHIVFGELVPKSIAIRKSESTTLMIAYPLSFFYVVFSPFISMMNGVSNFILNLIQISPAGEQEIHTSEELKVLVKQSKEGGAIQKENYDIIKNAFDFTDYTVKQIMVPRQQVYALDIELSVEEILKNVIENGYTRVPIYEKTIDHIIGILYVKDLLKAHYSHQNIDIRKIIHQAHFIFENTRISSVMSMFQKTHIHMAVIIDEYGGMQGIVTLEDVIEELVGEIQDEDDDERPIVDKINDDEYVVNATQLITDINEKIPVSFPVSDEYSTLAGYLLLKLGRLPKLDEITIQNGYEIKITKVQQRTTQFVKIKLLPKNE